MHSLLNFTNCVAYQIYFHYRTLSHIKYYSTHRTPVTG